MIPTTLPTSKRRPGAYSEFQFISSASLVPLPLRVVVVAEKLAAGSATIELPIQIFNETDGDAKLGTGSLAAILCRKAFAQANKSGNSPEVWACPVAEPGGGTKQVETITITVPGSPAVTGNLVLMIKDVLVTVGVSAGDSPTTIALAIQQALLALATTLPIVPTVAAGVVTSTFTTKGVNGNDLKYQLVSAPAGVVVTFAVGTAGAGVAVIANALAALYDQRYHAICPSNHTTTDVASILTDAASAWGFAQQNFRFYFMGEAGSLGTAQTLQAAANDYRLCVISAEQCPALPGEMAVAAAVAEFAREKPNANLDGEQLVLGLPPASYAYIDSEVESALNGGVTPLTPDGPWMKIESLITTQITLNGAPFEPLRDIAYPRTAAYRAEQIAINYKAKFKQQVATDDLLKRVRNMVVGIDRQLEELEILRDVDTFVDQCVTQYASSPAGRILVSAPFRPAGPVHQLDVVNTMYL